jgi:hypothetical protein
MGAKLVTAEIAEIDPAQVSGGPLITGYGYWNALRGMRPHPRRDELNPRHISGLLGYMTLVKVIGDGADFEYRIVGDVVVQAFHVPIQHRRFSEIAKEAPELIYSTMPLFRDVVADAKPRAWRQHTGRDATHVVFTDSEVLLLPLGDQNVEYVLGFTVHHATVSAAKSLHTRLRPAL